jgi:hypothetical protein
MNQNYIYSDAIKYPYAPPRELAANLWIVDGTWTNSLGRKMTVLRTRNNEVWIHNPMQLRTEELNWLSSLGFVRTLIAPNLWHVSDLLWIAEQFPHAQIICPRTFLNKHPQLTQRILFTTDVSYVSEDRELEFFPVAGVRFEESVVFHLHSRTLVVCDLLMNMPMPQTSLKRLLYTLNNMGDGCAPTRAMKWLMTNDKKKLLRFAEQLAELNPRRIIVNHGCVYEGEGGNQIRTSFAALFDWP